MKDSNCIFCKIANGEIPSRTIAETDMFRVVLDVGPATKGHAILLVKQHVENIFELDEQLAGKIFSVVPKVAKALKEELGCEGMNILQNNGTEAGQTVFHLHIHFIPRWKDDTIQIKWTPTSYGDGEAEQFAKAVRERL